MLALNNFVVGNGAGLLELVAGAGLAGGLTSGRIGFLLVTGAAVFGDRSGLAGFTGVTILVAGFGAATLIFSGLVNLQFGKTIPPKDYVSIYGDYTIMTNSKQQIWSKC